jgi:hypothetical protein
MNHKAMRTEADGLIAFCTCGAFIESRSIEGFTAHIYDVTGQRSITCPVCLMTSFNPHDREMGYCGNCHGYTSSVNPLETAMRVIREANGG